MKSRGVIKLKLKLRIPRRKIVTKDKKTQPPMSTRVVCLLKKGTIRWIIDYEGDVLTVSRRERVYRTQTG